MRVESVNCPNCTAPLPHVAGQTAAICLYCNSSIQLAPATNGAATLQTTTQTGVSAEIIEQVKQLVVDGKRAEVLKTAVIRPDFRRDGSLVVVLLEVQPEGRPAFRDQETLLVYNRSLPKIQPGKIIRVRFNPGNQDRVFPLSPIQAWDAAVGEFV
jgi:hypothetical protein